MERESLKMSEPWIVTHRPAVSELNPRELRLSRFGTALYVISQAIPYFVLVNVRWMMAGNYIPADTNQFGGLLPTISLAIGIVFTLIGMNANKRGETGRLQMLFTISVLLGVFSTITLMIPLWTHPFDTLSHYGEIYVVCMGVAAFYTVITTIVVLGVILRSRAGLIGAKTFFGPESATVVWIFNTLAWFTLYVALYLI